MNGGNAGERSLDGEMADATPHAGAGYDAVVIGASLAGSAAAIMLARAGARVALVDKRQDPAAFKRVCGHYILSSALPTIERLGLLEAMMNAGAVRSRFRSWTQWGWIDAGASSTVAPGINLRRELLDPLIRRAAADTPGVELILGRTLHELLREGDRVSGVALRDRRATTTRLRARLVVGADGRASTVAELAGVRSRVHANGRFNYATYFEGPAPAGAPDGSVWLTDPAWAGAFPTDSGLTLYTCMPTKDRLAEFRRDPAAGLTAFLAALPDAPPILASRHVGPLVGKLEVPIVARTPIAPGLALIGDAALAPDPMLAVGCGWALQSAEWLADSLAPALRGEERLERGLARYRRRHSRSLRGHALMMRRTATGRRLNGRERFMLSAAPRDERLSNCFEELTSRNVGLAHFLPRALPRALAVKVRHAPRPPAHVADHGEPASPPAARREPIR
jgi:menaquinone-9 beta-reductase